MRDRLNMNIKEGGRKGESQEIERRGS
jgi:hypothetical protein